MSQQPIIVLGAGIAGLTLGRCLKQKGIPAILYEKASAHPRYNYGITLHAWAYRPLLKVLELDELTFRRETSVDGPDGVGKIHPESSSATSNSLTASFYAHRGTLDTFLSRGLDIRREGLLKDATLTQNGVLLSFANGETLQPSVIISADGVHSQLRKTLVPKAQLSILPCVVFNGKRHVDKIQFQAIYAPSFKGANTLEVRHEDVLLRASISQYTENAVDISYTYSRLPRPNDALHNPTRSNASATDIPEEFFAEVAALHVREQPFAEIFDVAKLRQDRLLHWLMRSVMVDGEDLSRLASHGIVTIGDAAHAEPILGGQGANAAMRDGVELAGFIAEHGRDDIASFYEPHRYQRWKDGVAESESRLGKMHQWQPDTSML